MADHEQWQQGAEHPGDALDRKLDAGLAKYATVEPRAGLEERILASLHAEREQIVRRSWWAWTVAGSLAFAVIIVAMVLLLKPANNTASHHPPIEARQAAETQVASNGETNGTVPRTQKPGKKPSVHLRRTAEAAEPKLEVFPSPLPLSEQEKMLASYVVEYPKQAALIAQARAEALRRDDEEEMQDEANSVR